MTDSILMYPGLQICTNIDQSGQHWAEDYRCNSTQKEGEEISGGSTTCSAKGGNLSVGWGMRPREDKAGGERKVWLRGLWQVSGWHNEGRSVAVALTLRYVGTAGRSNHLHPTPSVIHYLLLLTIDISVIDSGEITTNFVYGENSKLK